MASKIFKMRVNVWLYPGPPAGGGRWHFVTVPKKQSEEIKKKFGSNARGWGSLPVTVTVGKTSWKTSIFPDKKEGAYLLPIKAEVRKKEGFGEGRVIDLMIRLR